ncbi:MAG: M23 family metallopeptidase [Acidobacteriaceae bacterium]
MKNNYKYLVLAVAVILILGLGLLKKPKSADSIPNQNNSSTGPTSQNTNADAASTNTAGLSQPLDKVLERVTKKPFGIFVTPKSSPVNPERFTGYHTGTDFEILPNEENSDVSVAAICSGKILRKETARGYGGLLTQSCTINGQAVTVYYGHIKLASVAKKAGDELAAGEKFAILGKGYSSETGGERKHLHLGIHKGTSIDNRGYVSSANLLPNWIDSQTVLPK